MHHMLTYSTDGLSTSMFLFAWVFVTLNLVLSISAHRAQPSTVTIQTLIIYILGTVIYGLFVVTMFHKAQIAWDTRDTLTSSLVAILSCFAITYAYATHTPVFDPIMKGWYSLICKATPQTITALKIFHVGGDGLSVTMVITFHILTLIRIYLIWQSIKEAGWDKNRRGLFISESGNECTWVLVTGAWLIH